VTPLRALVTRHWPLKLASIVFATGLFVFVATEERTEAVFTVPLELVDRPPNLEIASIGVDAVVIRVEGRDSRLRRLHEEDFRAEVSLKNARPGRFVARIDPDNVLAPAGVRVVRVSPAEVRAVLEAR
jgi:hypothetical protein